jgi:hypothetical protein
VNVVARNKLGCNVQTHCLKSFIGRDASTGSDRRRFFYETVNSPEKYWFGHVYGISLLEMLLICSPYVVQAGGGRGASASQVLGIALKL